MPRLTIEVILTLRWSVCFLPSQYALDYVLWVSNREKIPNKTVNRRSFGLSNMVQAFVIALDLTMVVCSVFIRFPFHILVGVKQTFQVHKHEDQMISMN